MLKIIALLIFSLCSLWGACKVPCQFEIQTQMLQTEQELEIEFKKTEQKIAEAKKSYEKQLEQLKTNNKELKVQIELMKSQLANHQELIFLLQQFNELQGIENSKIINED